MCRDLSEFIVICTKRCVVMLSTLRKVSKSLNGSSVSNTMLTNSMNIGIRAMSSFRILRLDNLSFNKGAFKKVCLS